MAICNETQKYYLDTLPFKPYGRVIALGLFDGLHKGHLEIIRKTVKLAKMSGLISTVQTFTGLNKSSGGDVLTLNERQKLLSELGVDEMLVLDFEQVRDVSPEDYLREIILQKCGAVSLCLGFDYSFGKGGKGTPELIKEFAKEFDIGVKVFEEKTLDGTSRKISTSWLKEALNEGDMDLARDLCEGRSFCYEGIVEEGKHLGRELGFPTLNVTVPENKITVKRGVYATVVTIGNQKYKAVTNVGLRPTVENANRDVVESYLFDFDEDRYGAFINVELIKFVRPEQRFGSEAELREQVNKDKETARECLKDICLN